MKKISKIVVFDLDETLGHFTELGMFWDTIQQHFHHDLGQESFNKICDLYPEFFRPHIFVILKFLINKTKHNKKNKVMIYTNNQGPRSWTMFIKNYIESKLNYKLFNQIICAFKVRGKQMEMCRTTHNKTYDDFIKCTKIPRSAEICFLDDQVHEDMEHDKVYYIHVKPYVYNIPFVEMIHIFVNSSIGKSLIEKYYNNNIDKFKDVGLNFLKKYEHEHYNKSKTEHNVDKIVSKKMMVHLQDFFNNNYSNGTIKIKKRMKNKTRKVR
jgi:hypothetical protein